MRLLSNNFINLSMFDIKCFMQLKPRTIYSAAIALCMSEIRFGYATLYLKCLILTSKSAVG